MIQIYLNNTDHTLSGVKFKYFVASPGMGHEDAFDDIVSEKSGKTRTVVLLSSVVGDFSQVVKILKLLF